MKKITKKVNAHRMAQFQNVALEKEEQKMLKGGNIIVVEEMVGG